MPPTRLIIVALAALLLAVGAALAACGGDDEGDGAEVAAEDEVASPDDGEQAEPPVTEDGEDAVPPEQAERRWRNRAAAVCSAAEQEAIALPLPETEGEVPADAFARAEILRDVHEQLGALEAPPELADDAAEYLGIVNRDISTLQAGGRIDESAGGLANDLGLPECAALANALARSP